MFYPPLCFASLLNPSLVNHVLTNRQGEGFPKFASYYIKSCHSPYLAHIMCSSKIVNTRNK